MSNAGKGFFTLLVGAAIGAAAALLLTPQSGAETRAQILDILRKKGIDIDSEQVEQLVQRVLAKVKGVMDTNHLQQIVEEELS